jgi:hypothetical protein
MIPNEKYKVTPNLSVCVCACVINNSTKFKYEKVNKTDILVTKLLSKRKSTPRQPNPGNQLTEEIASYKAIVLTYLWCSSCTLNSNTYLPKLDFNGLIKSHK